MPRQCGRKLDDVAHADRLWLRLFKKVLGQWEGVLMRIKLLTRTMLTLSIAVMAILGKAHAGTSLPKEIVGMWCYYSPGENADARSYLRNDASAPKPDTPCMKGGNTEWIAIDANGSYRGQEYGCKAVGVTVIDRGVVISGKPGANAIYGLDARCEGKGATWRERARIEVERWGSALTIRRTNTNPG
jgi:hypothetical protein